MEEIWRIFEGFDPVSRAILVFVLFILVYGVVVLCFVSPFVVEQYQQEASDGAHESSMQVRPDDGPVDDR